MAVALIKGYRLIPKLPASIICLNVMLVRFTLTKVKRSNVGLRIFYGG